jgi:hypothetical protein
MATPREMNPSSDQTRYILMQHQNGVSLTLNIFPDDKDPRALIEEYGLFLEDVADFPGYAPKRTKSDDDYERGKKAGAASRGRR